MTGGWFEERGGLAGTVAVITGGAGGLGRAIAADLAANGVRIAVLDIDAEAAVGLRDELASRGAAAIVQTGDARDSDALTQLFRAVDECWGRVDTLVNVVGGTFRAPFLDTTPKGWDALLTMNLKQVLHACSLAARRMQAGGRGGAIINISTIEAHRAAPGFAVYAAAKAAVEQFGRTRTTCRRPTSRSSQPPATVACPPRQASA
jgi:NAD(P)-dependent dehydrogenase (short-subunit alcohol dehydrogenase family)